MDINDFINGFAEQFDDTDMSEFTEDCRFKELDEWSSLSAMSIIAYVKTACGKTISAREIRNCVTIGDLYKLVSEL